MVAKEVFEGGSVAFGDFPPSPVGLPTQKLSLSPPPKRQRAVYSTPPSTPPSKEADVHFSGGSDAQQGAALSSDCNSSSPHSLVGGQGARTFVGKETKKNG